MATSRIKDRPILCRGIPIVGRMPLFTFNNRQAVHDNLKTQTRRLNGLEEINQDSDRWQFVGFKDDQAIFRIPGRTQRWIKLPWAVGDTRCMCEPLFRNFFSEACYRDDREPVRSLITGRPIPWRWKRDYLASIHMPTEAARTICRITDIRVEKLQEISDEDAEAEGIQWCRNEFGVYQWKIPGDKDGWFDYANDAFGYLWDSINKAKGYGWDVPQWVFVNAFEKLEI